MNRKIFIILLFAFTVHGQVYKTDLPKLVRGYQPFEDSLIVLILAYAGGGDTSHYVLYDWIIGLPDTTGVADDKVMAYDKNTHTIFWKTDVGGAGDTSHYSLFSWIIGLQDSIDGLQGAIGSIVDNAVFSVGWNGETATSPSQDAVYDEMIKKLAITTLNDSNFVLMIETSAWDKNAGDDATQYTDELAQDAVGLNVGAGLSYNDIAGEISSTITQYTDELSQDAFGAMADANTLSYTDLTPKLEVKTQMSITDDASGLKLSGDASSPGNSMLYGTNGSGTKGWYAQPGGVSDGDKGDITVSGLGATWNVDNGAIPVTELGSVSGLLSDIQFTVLQGDGNLSEASGVQTWAGSDRTTQDVFTVAANTTYYVEGQWIVNTGSTTHTTAIAWSTGATITRFEYTATLWSAAANTIATAQSTTHVSGVASKILNATSTAVYTMIQFTGILVVGSTAGGSTITPQINFSANPTGSCLMKAGSFIRMIRLGTDTVIETGGWE